jgi:hypothetical protein
MLLTDTPVTGMHGVIAFAKYLKQKRGLFLFQQSKQGVS